MPSLCAICSCYHRESAVCKDCFCLFTRLQHTCERCKLPLEGAGFALCGFCIKQPPHFDNIHTAYIFEEPLRSLLHDFKYKKAFFLRFLFLRLLIEALPQDLSHIEAVLPVPLHPSSLRERGFNQAAELAKLLAKSLGIPYNGTLCQKHKATEAQMKLGRTQRLKNLNYAFSVAQNTYQHVLLVDDIVTTGSTVNVLAQALKEKGVARVEVCCIARTKDASSFA